jgi:hypothetical protein
MKRRKFTINRNARRQQTTRAAGREFVMGWTKLLWAARADLWREERGKAKKLAWAVVGDFYRRSNRPTYSRKSSSASGVVWATRAMDHYSGFLISGTSDFGF